MDGHFSFFLLFIYFFSLSLLCCSFHETEKDGSERLHSEACHKLLRLQAVSIPSDSCYCSAFSGGLSIEKHKLEEMPVICPQEKLCCDFPDQLIHMKNNCGFFQKAFVEWTKFELFVFFQSRSSVYSELEYSSGCWAHEHKPVSSCKYICTKLWFFLCLHVAVCRATHPLFTCLSYILEVIMGC